MALFTPLPAHDCHVAVTGKGVTMQSSCPPNSPANHGLSTVILGGGLAGLTTGYALTEAGHTITLLEGAAEVGGLSKTISHNGFLFDLGGHRFLTKNKQIEDFFLKILAGQILNVPRKSQIYLLNKFFDYPLQPVNASFGLGVSTTIEIVTDYCKERVKNLFAPPDIVSLEDWVINRFGQKMFDIYFKDYSEKVWGISCSEISQEWVAQRISGLSLWAAIKNAFCKLSGKNLLTLSDEFFYPALGIGQLSNRLQEGIEKTNSVVTNTKVNAVFHHASRIEKVSAINCNGQKILTGDEFVSSIPLTQLIELLDPPPPAPILAAARSLKYRDLIIVTLMLNRERVTDLTWMYLPGKDIPFGRIHEPKNWSPHMAPEGKTHVVAEFFCFKGDSVWNATDDQLKEMTVKHLAQLGFIQNEDVLDSCVLRLCNAYPIFDVGYQKHCDTIMNYLNGFSNLHVVGRGGLFKYYNMDHAMESGINAAENIIAKNMLTKHPQAAAASATAQNNRQLAPSQSS